jgi:hypothetical protein
MRPTASAQKKSNANVLWIEPMQEQPHSPPRFAVCINNTEYPASLERHKIYRALPEEEAAKDGDLRVIDESGKDYLYPAELFVLIEVPKAVERALLQTS